MSTRGGTLLLVDDEQKIRRMLGQALRAEGHDVLEADSVREAKSTMADRSVDVLIPVGTPGLDHAGVGVGIEAVKSCDLDAGVRQHALRRGDVGVVVIGDDGFQGDEGQYGTGCDSFGNLGRVPVEPVRTGVAFNPKI